MYVTISIDVHMYICLYACCIYIQIYIRKEKVIHPPTSCLVTSGFEQCDLANLNEYEASRKVVKPSNSCFLSGVELS